MSVFFWEFSILSFCVQQPNEPQINNVIEGRIEKGVKPCTSMKIIVTTLISRQHSRQVNNKKLKNTWH